MPVLNLANLPPDAGELLDMRCAICGIPYTAANLRIQLVEGRYMLVCEDCYQRGALVDAWGEAPEVAPAMAPGTVVAPIAPAPPAPATV